MDGLDLVVWRMGIRRLSLVRIMYARIQKLKVTSVYPENMSLACIGCSCRLKLDCGIWPSLARSRKVRSILTPNDKYHILKPRIFIPVIRFRIPFTSTWLERNKSRVTT